MDQSVTEAPGLGDWPQGDLEAVAACPACGSENRVLRFQQLIDRVFFCAPGFWNFVQCTDCQSLYLDSRPTPESMARAYTSYFTHESDTAHEITGNSFRQRMGNDYRYHRYGIESQFRNPLGRHIVRLMPTKKREIDLYHRFLPRRAGQGSRALDLGCGNGKFFNIAARAGWIACGVEPDPMAREIAQSGGFEVRPSIEDWEDCAGQFGFISLNHVIEHLHDPRHVIDLCRRLLAPGGTLYIDTPNAGAAGLARFGSVWLPLDPPRHLVLFTRKSLQHMLAGLGFGRFDWVPRPEVAEEMAMQSDRVARSLDPYTGALTELPLPVRQPGDALADPSHPDEFLTVVARKLD